MNTNRYMMASAAAAVAFFFYGFVVNVILLDVYMPEMRGDVVLSKLKQVFPKIPVIMISGYDDDDMAKACMEAGAYDFVSKPFDFDYLETSVFSTVN